MRIFTILILLVSTSLLFAGNGKRRQIDKGRFFPLTKKSAGIIRPLYEPLQSSAFSAKAPLFKSGAVRQAASGAYHVQVGTSANGYGWLNTAARSLDHFSGSDVDNGEPISYVALAFRGTQTSALGSAADIREAEVDVSNGLSSGDTYLSDELNSSLGGVGGRYPCIVALDRPFVSYNQYMEGNTEDSPAISHPYTIASFGTYGMNGNSWTVPDFRMDVGWLNPTIQNFTQYKENRLWNGPVSIVKDEAGIYHYLSVYNTWYSKDERSYYGVQMEKYILNAKSVDGYAADGWTYGWDEGHEPVWIDTAKVTLAQSGVAMNSSGFGVVAGPGHLGYHAPDSGYYYNTIRITYATTNDYGLTWSDFDTVGMTEMGFPSFIDSADHEIIWDIDTTVTPNDTVYYHGPAFLGGNFDMSVMVDNDNTIYVTFVSLWGIPGDGVWYYSYLYSGVWMAKKPVDGPWQAYRIAYNNGIWVGDDEVPGVFAYFTDNEPQMAMDDWGNLYAAWLDRRHNQVQVSRFNRYSDPETAGSFMDFKTDVFMSYSTDGGQTWSEPVNATDSPSLDEYELNMALHAGGVNGKGTAWFAYTLADTASGNPGTDAYIELSNAVWVGEQQFDSLDVPVGIDNGTPQIVQTPVLYQNYPNPFNPSTRIRFIAGSSGSADLSVYNVAGQKIIRLYNGKVRKGQKYDVTFNAHALSAGVYFYRLTQNGFSSTKKMILIK